MTRSCEQPIKQEGGVGRGSDEMQRSLVHRRIAPRQGAKASFDGRNVCQKCFCVTFGESNKAYAVSGTSTFSQRKDVRLKRTISAMRGPGSLNHNRRSFTAENVDPERSSLNVMYRDEPIQKVYHELFDEAVDRYNAKQKRKDRCVNDYYEHLRTGKQEKLFHELIVQIGNKDDMGVLTENGALAKELLDEYMQGFQERNPTLRVFGAFLHMDEATPHLHIDFVPYVSGWKGKGLDTKVSLKQALKALSFAGGSKRESELNQWINAEKEQLAAVMERHGIEWEQKGTHEEHLSVLDFKKQERSKEVAALEAAKQECQADLAEMQEQLETVQTAADAAEQRAQQANKAYQKQSKELNKELNKLAPIMDGLESLSAQYSQRPEEWVPEAGTFETAKSYREKKAVPLIKKLVQVIFSLHRKYWEMKHDRDKYQGFYRSEKDVNRNLSRLLEQAEAENEQFRAMKRDFGRVWNYFGAEKMNQVIGLMREQEQTVKQNPQKSRENSVEL